MRPPDGEPLPLWDKSDGRAKPTGSPAWAEVSGVRRLGQRWMAENLFFSIESADHVLVACQAGQTLAARFGFSQVDQARVRTAIAEVAQNLVRYARGGQIVIQSARHQGDGRPGIVVIARDQGPGIPDVEKALHDGYSSGGSLGLGLSGARRLMDEFAIDSHIGQGTVVVMKKWKA